MKTKLFSLFVAFLTCRGIVFADPIQIGDLYYTLNDENQTAVVDYHQGGFYTGNITIPASVNYNSVTYSVTSIGDGAFNGCSGLTSVTIPNSVTSIGEGAFVGCTGLTSIEIPNSVTNIERDAFLHCTGLPVENNIRYADTYLVETADKTLSTYTIKEGTKWIGSGAFELCHGLTNIEIPNSVINIGFRACMDCYNLTSIVIGNSVTSIGIEAFSFCSGLTSITIPNSVTSIGVLAFNGCTGLTSVTIPNSVTSIGGVAFYECTGLTSATIGEGVSNIGDGVFSGCTGLTSIVVDNANTKYDSRDNCNAIIETATNTLITGCNNTIIPNSVTSIGDYAFDHCTSLTSITIPNSVTSIGEWAFFFCTGLTSIEIPNSITSIGEWAFSDCTGLTSVTIGNSVESIGMFAFDYCTGLTSITIPNSVTSIGEWAFDYCTGLTSIICEAVIPPICVDSWVEGIEYCFVFDGVNKSIPLYVPVNSINAYKAANGWKDFQNIRGIGTAVENVLFENIIQKTKIVRNGQLFIQQGEKTYNAQGARVR